MPADSIPVIDISCLIADPASEASGQVAASIDQACRDVGFFAIKGHGIEPELQDRLEAASHSFFGLEEAEKNAVAMSLGGAAWRGWFPLGGELTSGVPDRKEGFYFGTEHAPDHPLVERGEALHGANLFPDRPPELGGLVLEWMEAVSALGLVVLRGVARGLGLQYDWFDQALVADPTVLFRIFHYPPADGPGWGVGEHTDYGLITILAQDECGGLQVDGANGWTDVPAERGVFVCNIGDMLERLTEGRYRSTLHRVSNPGARNRLSFPLFIDPSWDAEVPVLPLDASPPVDRHDSRWDEQSVLQWEGPYGDYLVNKVSKVFPELFADTRLPGDSEA